MRFLYGRRKEMQLIKGEKFANNVYKQKVKKRLGL